MARPGLQRTCIAPHAAGTPGEANKGAARKRVASFLLDVALAISSVSTPVIAAPFRPASDDMVVETLPTVAGFAASERRLQRELVQNPRNQAAALTAAASYLNLAREQADARYAGYAMGALQPWLPIKPDTPPPVLVMHATLAQYLHDFDGARSSLKLALASAPMDAQAWLTLATIDRVQGRLNDSDASCRQLAALAQPVYAQACQAENAGLRGNADTALETLNQLLSARALAGPEQAGTRRWLWTTVAEVEELADRPNRADAAYRQALGDTPSGYTALAYADFLLDQKRPSDVLPLLAAQPRSDAVLIRLVMAREMLSAIGPLPIDALATAQRDAEELRARFDAAALRPDTGNAHARERALYALAVLKDPVEALTWARRNVELQREPIDLALLARSAAAAGDETAKKEARALLEQTGLRDKRLDGLL